MQTMLPNPRERKWGTTACDMLSVPRRLTSSTAS